MPTPTFLLDAQGRQAAELLVTPSALGALDLEDALEVVGYMRPMRIAAGTVFVREGAIEGNDHMLLVLEGDVSVENSLLQDEDDQMVVRFLGAGSLLGELGLLDGGPRSASCVAHTELSVAVLSRADLHQLLQERPRVGARLLLAIAQRMAETLRETTRKLRLFAQMNQALGEELAQMARGEGDEAGA